MKRALVLFAAVALMPIGGLAQAPQSSQAAPTIKTAVDVISAFQQAGLPVRGIQAFDAATDPNRLLGRPGQYVSKASFFDKRHRPDGELVDVNTVEVFTTPAAAKARRDYVERVTRDVPYLLQYQVLNGRVLVRFDKAMLPAEVAEYEAVLAKAMSAQKAVPVRPSTSRQVRRPT